ncbi:MAG: NADH-quinone oxidoreductase subunit NuoK [Candidatus Nitrosotenuis sp.]
MEGVPLSGYLALSIVLFAIGTLGVLLKRNPIVIFMCIELMLNSANLAFLAFGRFNSSPIPTQVVPQVDAFMSGQMAVIFVMAVAAAEVAVGLGIIMAIFRLRKEIDIDDLSLMRG